MIQFTGNWYIDMGIIGMLNLLKEDSKTEKFKELIELIQSKNFPYVFTKAYLKHHLKIHNASLKKDIKEFKVKENEDKEKVKSIKKKLKNINPATKKADSLNDQLSKNNDTLGKKRKEITNLESRVGC